MPQQRVTRSATHRVAVLRKRGGLQRGQRFLEAGEAQGRRHLHIGVER